MPQRDPAGRRQTIIAAAAELLAAGRSGRLTHRLVADAAAVPLGSTTYYFSSLDELTAAAMAHLADQLDHSLAETAAEIRRTEAAPDALAGLLHDYLGQTEQMNSEAALYVAALERPELQPLSRRYFDGLVGVLREFTDADTATALAVFLDGAVLHAALHGQPLGRETIARVARLLLAGHPETADLPGKGS